MNAGRRFRQRILQTYFVRWYMTIIVAAVIAAGLGASKLLLECGVYSPQWRYPIALFASFAAFLLLVRAWIWYVFPRKPIHPDNAGDMLDFPDGGGESVHFDGGDSGGGGASDSWADAHSVNSFSGGSSPSGSSGGSGFDLDLDELAILLVAAALVLAIISAGGYLIYTAPDLLPEAAWQATLASGLARAPRPSGRQGWLRCVLRASIIPFAAVLIFVVALAYLAHHQCPTAVKLAEALHCAER